MGVALGAAAKLQPAAVAPFKGPKKGAAPEKSEGETTSPASNMCFQLPPHLNAPATLATKSSTVEPRERKKYYLKITRIMIY